MYIIRPMNKVVLVSMNKAELVSINNVGLVVLVRQQGCVGQHELG